MTTTSTIRKWFIICALQPAALGMAGAQSVTDLENKVVEKTLANGLKVIMLPRPNAPVISMVTYELYKLYLRLRG